MKKLSMPVTISKFKKHLGKDNIITIPLSLFNICNNVFNGILQVGMDNFNVIFLPNFTDNKVEISEKLFNHFNFEDNLQSNVIMENDTLKLGPVVAVFVSNGTIRKANNQEPNFRISELTDANKKAKTILYFFSIKDVDFVSQKINGTHYNSKNSTWEKKWFPLPDVLYDRGGGVLSSQKIISRYIRKQLDNNNDLKKINPKYYFDKWDVYLKLSEQDEMSPYLPPTVKYEKTQDLELMFKKSNTLFIKDRYGSNGRGIIKVIKANNNTFEYSYFKTDIIQGRVKSINELKKIINKFLENKKAIIQTGINVININNKPVDMRATVQRNKEGKIEVSACPVRAGLANFPITSTRSGANVYKFEDFFCNLLNYSYIELENLKERVYDFLITSYRCIEKAYGIFGEIGIDFAIDTNGLLWFIECNAKPGKDTVYIAYDKKTVKKVFLNPLEYSKYITGFN